MNKKDKYNHVNFCLKDENKQETDQRALVRCPACNLENYAFNVLSGICTWCGFDINEEKKGD